MRKSDYIAASLCIALFCIGTTMMAVSAHAQMRASIAQGDLLYWEIEAPDGATATSYTVHLRDGGILVLPSLPVIGCASAGPGVYTCRAAIPAALAPGDHTLTLTTIAPGNAEGNASNALSVTVTLPLSPQPHNLRTTAQ